MFTFALIFVLILLNVYLMELHHSFSIAEKQSASRASFPLSRQASANQNSSAQKLTNLTPGELQDHLKTIHKVRFKPDPESFQKERAKFPQIANTNKGKISSGQELHEPSLQPNATFSACLLIKDDNDLLNEWIGYHYFSLKMRTLLVAVDPTSNEFPSKIFSKWRRMTDLNVIEWTDTDYMPPQFLTTNHPPPQFMLHKNNFSFPGNISFPLSDETLLQIR